MNLVLKYVCGGLREHERERERERERRIKNGWIQLKSSCDIHETYGLPITTTKTVWPCDVKMFCRSTGNKWWLWPNSCARFQVTIDYEPKTSRAAVIGDPFPNAKQVMFVCVCVCVLPSCYWRRCWCFACCCWHWTNEPGSGNESSTPPTKPKKRKK